MASIGRVKPYVFTGTVPDPNTVSLHAPGFPSPQDQPQPSDMYVNKVDSDNFIFWVFGFVQNSSTPAWALVGSGGDGVGPAGPQGIVGPAGPSVTGPQGPPGPPGGSYTHMQDVSSAYWDIWHGLGFTPNVIVVDSIGDVVYGDVQILSPDHLTVEFTAPFTGIAYLS